MIDVDALKARTNLAEVVGHYTALQKRGQEFVGRCVWHSPDNNPSMWVVPAKGLVHCFACGGSGDVIEFIQHVEGCDFKTACEKLGATDQWSPSISLPPRIPRPNRVTSKPPPSRDKPDMRLRDFGDPVGTWAYFDAVGDVIGYVARYQGPDGKEYRPWTWGAYGEERPEWGIGQWTKPRPLYGLDRLAGKPDAPVIIVEGEKAADAAAALLPAYAVVTWPGGADGWRVVDYLPLAGRTVLLWPDADPPGVKAMARIADLLSDPAGLACTVSVLDVEGMPEGSDAADWTEDTAALIAWAKPRKRPHKPEKPAIAPEPLQAIETVEEPPPPDDDDSGQPVSPVDTPPAPRPIRRRPQLAVVGGSATAPALDDEPLPMELSESGMADEFAAGNRHDLRYVPEWRERGWLVWNGSRWKREARRNTAMQRMRAISHGLKYRAEAAPLSPAGKGRLESKNYCGNVLDLSETDQRLIATPQQWDADPFLLGVPGGTVDLRTGDMRDCLPEQFITRQTAVAPVEGPTPLFDRVLAQAADGDAEMLDYLWRWLGYCLTGDVREESFLFLYGPPACGKTTLIEAVAAIMGDSHDAGYAVKTTMELFIETRVDKGAGRFHILHGARFAHAAETEEGRHWKAAMVKEATGGDTMIGERKYENEFSFRPTHKLVIHGNHRPHMRQADEGLRRRMHIVEYHASVEASERDVTLKQRLVAEYPAILFRMIQGCLDWQRGGLRSPEPITKAVAEYFEAEDSFGAWRAECLAAHIGGRLSSTGAYNNFKDWLQARGEHAPSHKRFTSLMLARGIAQVKSSGAMFFRDVELSAHHLTPPDFGD